MSNFTNVNDEEWVRPADEIRRECLLSDNNNIQNPLDSQRPFLWNLHSHSTTNSQYLPNLNRGIDEEALQYMDDEEQIMLALQLSMNEDIQNEEKMKRMKIMEQEAKIESLKRKQQQEEEERKRRYKEECEERERINRELKQISIDKCIEHIDNLQKCLLPLRRMSEHKDSLKIVDEILLNLKDSCDNFKLTEQKIHYETYPIFLSILDIISDSSKVRKTLPSDTKKYILTYIVKDEDSYPSEEVDDEDDNQQNDYEYEYNVDDYDYE